MGIGPWVGIRVWKARKSAGREWEKNWGGERQNFERRSGFIWKDLYGEAYMEKEKEGGGRDIERGEELFVVVPWRERSGICGGGGWILTPSPTFSFLFWPHFFSLLYDAFSGYICNFVALFCWRVPRARLLSGRVGERADVNDPMGCV